MYGCTCTVRVVLLEGTSYSVLHYRAPRAFNVDRTLALYMWLIFWVGRETTACFRRTTAIYWFARFQRVCARLGGAYDDGCPLEQQANGAGMGTGQLGCRIYTACRLLVYQAPCYICDIPTVPSPYLPRSPAAPEGIHHHMPLISADTAMAAKNIWRLLRTFSNKLVEGAIKF